MSRSLTPILAALLVCWGASASRAAPVQEAPPTARYEWVFVYYMSYDNNLERMGEPILGMLERGVTHERVAVVVFADFRDRDGMQRILITTAGREVTPMEEEASGEERVLGECLTWVAGNLEAARYAVTFLDHGGRLDEMCSDDHPGPDSDRRWLNLPRVAGVLGSFRAQVHDRVELVFLQQCGKGTLENYYEMRGAAPWIMGSQVTVGAPNYYYTDALRAICERPDRSGREVGRLIMDHETDDMFTTYTIVSSEALEELPARLNEALEPLAAREAPVAASRAAPCFEPGPGERMIDGLEWLRAMYAVNELDEAPLDRFAAWVSERLVVEHRVSPQRERVAGGWCGFSMYAPRSREALDRYPLQYHLYGETCLDELLLRLLPQDSP